MSKWEKLLAEIANMSKEIRFDEVRKVLEHYGYTMKQPRGGSSHYTFRKPGMPAITIPRTSKIKRTYVELLKKVVEDNESEDEPHNEQRAN